MHGRSGPRSVSDFFMKGVFFVVFSSPISLSVRSFRPRNNASTICFFLLFFSLRPKLYSSLYSKYGLGLLDQIHYTQVVVSAYNECQQHYMLNKPSKHAGSDSLWSGSAGKHWPEAGRIILAHWLASVTDRSGPNLTQSARAKLDPG